MQIDPVALRDLRSRALLTQEELADKAEMSDRAIGKIEAGHTKAPRISTIRKLAAALGADASEFTIQSEDAMGGKGSGRKGKNSANEKVAERLKAAFREAKADPPPPHVAANARKAFADQKKTKK